MAKTSEVPRRVRVYQVGSAVVWAAIWLGTAVVLRGQIGEFGTMLPILAIGAVLGLGLPPSGGLARHLLGQCVVWAALVAATVVLSGTASLLPGLLVLGGGVVWSLVACPVLLRSRR
jgi:hypothetical protein